MRNLNHALYAVACLVTALLYNTIINTKIIHNNGQQETFTVPHQGWHCHPHNARHRYGCLGHHPRLVSPERAADYRREPLLKAGFPFLYKPRKGGRTHLQIYSTLPPQLLNSSSPHLHNSSPPQLLTSTTPHLHNSSPPHLHNSSPPQLLISSTPLPPHLLHLPTLIFC